MSLQSNKAQTNTVNAYICRKHAIQPHSCAQTRNTCITPVAVIDNEILEVKLLVGVRERDNDLDMLFVAETDFDIVADSEMLSLMLADNDELRVGVEDFDADLVSDGDTVADTVAE